MYDGVNAPRWNLGVKPFVVWWVVEKEEDTRMWGGRRSHCLEVLLEREGIVVESN
jgi:hypothetical protein